MSQKDSYFTIYRIAFIAIMAAVVYVLTLFRFPFLGSKVHFANAMCLLSGLLFGPLGGGLAAGLGSGLYDLLGGGYGVVEALITTVSKFLMAAICAWIAGAYRSNGRLPADSGAGFSHHYRALWKSAPRIIIGCVAGALSYVALYMLKTMIKGFLYTPDAVWVNMASKLPASLINALFAILAAPVLYAAILPPLKKAGVMEKL